MTALLPTIGRMEALTPLRRAAVASFRPTYRSGHPVVSIRTELPLLLNRRGLTGTAAEIGVKRGQFSEEILAAWEGRKLISIDPWLADPSGDYVDRANVDQPAHEAYLQETRDRLARFGARSEIWRLTSIEAAERVEPRSLDFVYIDARHDYDSVLEDLGAWVEKVRPGGVFAGHDYIDDRRREGEFGVKSAVREFFGARGLRIASTFADVPWPSWLVIVE